MYLRLLKRPEEDVLPIEGLDTVYAVKLRRGGSYLDRRPHFIDSQTFHLRTEPKSFMSSDWEYYRDDLSPRQRQSVSSLDTYITIQSDNAFKISQLTLHDFPAVLPEISLMGIGLLARAEKKLSPNTQAFYDLYPNLDELAKETICELGDQRYMDIKKGVDPTNAELLYIALAKLV